VEVVGDLIAFWGGMNLAFHARTHLHSLFGHELLSLRLALSAYTGHFIFGSILFLGLAGRMGMYSPQNVLRLRKTFIAATNAAIVWALMYLFLSLVFSFSPLISRIFVALSMCGGLALVLIWRRILLAIIDWLGISRQLRQRLLIVGSNTEANKLTAAIMNDPSRAYDIVGCLPLAHNQSRLNPPKEIRRLGVYQEIKDIHERDRIDIVLLDDLDPDTGEVIALSEFCQREMIQFKMVPTYFQILISGLHLESISGAPVLGIARLPLDSRLCRIFKRSIDIVGAIVGLVLTLPLLVVFGALVYRESPGPVIYRQQRMGRRGHNFEMYKIRSMRLDAEKDGPRWTQPNDSRCLKIGAFMRKWNIDEVPQFWNVLTGQMSLVGPRPERPELIEDFKDQIRHYNARHNVKPGMTGWAQIRGLRGETNLDERIRCDLYYLENWTPILDFYIMLVTFFRNLNAY
jgi:exopolysaccharide biosynthesis polyprenyl glycosylphosphotransferase